jgi:hypothetical protein
MRRCTRWAGAAMFNRGFLRMIGQPECERFAESGLRHR